MLSVLSYSAFSGSLLQGESADAVTIATVVGLASVLIVEDNEAIGEMLLAVLHNRYNVHIAPTAQAAMQMLERHRPRLILCDARLPDGDGYELAATLNAKSETADIPLVIMSGFDDGNSARRAREAGAAGFLPKPFNVSELFEILKQHLAG